MATPDAADRAVSEVRAELRAHTQVLNALRDTQLEQGQAMAEQSRVVAAGISTVNAGMAEIVGRLDELKGAGDG